MRWVAKMSVGPFTRLSPLLPKRANQIVFPSAESAGS